MANENTNRVKNICKIFTVIKQPIKIIHLIKFVKKEKNYLKGCRILKSNVGTKKRPFRKHF